MTDYMHERHEVVLTLQDLKWLIFAPITSGGLEVSISILRRLMQIWIVNYWWETTMQNVNVRLLY